MRNTLRKLVLISAVFLLTVPAAAPAQVNPPAPQSPSSSDGVDAPGFVRVPATARGGTGGFVDVPAYAACRYVTVGNPNAGGEAIALQSATNWTNWRTNPPPGDSQTVCCRPQTVTLCQGAAGGAVTRTLPYTVFAQQQFPAATCTDQWGQTYTDMQTWTCGATGSGVAADGQWNAGGDSLTCAPNAFTSGCSASCGPGTTTTYNSCGQVQSVNACNNGPCCTTNWEISSTGACSGSCGGGYGYEAVTYTDYGTCNSGSYTTTQGCINSTPCCTNNWQVSSTGACSGACGGGSGTQSVTYTNYGTCGGGYTTTQGCTNSAACCVPNWQYTACNQGTGQKTRYDANNCPGSVSTQVACTYGVLGSATCSPYNDWVSGKPQSQQGACAVESGPTFLTCGAVGNVCPSTWSGSGDAAGAGNPALPNCSGGSSQCNNGYDSQGALDAFSCCGYY